ncbi:MAG TPA: helix-turn-helix domain-containing protein [Microbacteriaceae bacterium]|nr:helix-turn-helix domain-containing protein [Microbacteriaceae bacterium]
MSEGEVTVAETTRRMSAKQTAARIELAAIDLALEHGFGAVTVDMICAQAGVSQRTFFNHFRTKEAAILGNLHPVIDQRAAREFVLATGPLLPGALMLVRLSGEDGTPDDPKLMARRFRAISGEPSLVAKQMEELAHIEGELVEILSTRLRLESERAGTPLSPEALERQSALCGHILGSLMLYINGFQHGRESDPAAIAARMRELPTDIGAVLGKLV